MAAVLSAVVCFINLSSQEVKRSEVPKKRIAAFLCTNIDLLTRELLMVAPILTAYGLVDTEPYQ